MRDEVHRRALLAAAKVAFGVSAAACASDPPPPQTPTQPAGPSTQTGSPASTTAPSAAKTGPNGCTLPASAPMSEAEMKCCLDAAGAFSPVNNAGPVPDHIKQCCNLVTSSKKSIGYDTCCEVTGNMRGGCTPWGPPVPPRMIARSPVTSDTAQG